MPCAKLILSINGVMVHKTLKLGWNWIQLFWVRIRPKPKDWAYGRRVKSENAQCQCWQEIQIHEDGSRPNLRNVVYINYTSNNGQCPKQFSCYNRILSQTFWK
jgi:hypothetical protein